jgi:hypothetical protein
MYANERLYMIIELGCLYILASCNVVARTKPEKDSRFIKHMPFPLLPY